jgi:outer membrane biosynthesis protein TonB
MILSIDRIQTPEQQLGKFVRYQAHKELPLAIFIAISISVLFVAVHLFARVITSQMQVQTVSVDLTPIEGSFAEPPPLGVLNPEAQDAPTEVPKQQEVTPDPPLPDSNQKIEEVIQPALPEPVQETPPPAPTTPPPPKPEAEFIEPSPIIEKAPAPEPRPEPAQEPPPPRNEAQPQEDIKKAVPPPLPKPKPSPNTAVKPAKSALPQTPSTPGSPAGVKGGRGGTHGDFVATPHPVYDTIAQQRGYQGTGEVLIIYQNGAIAAVTMKQSTGVSYLDSRTTSWVKARYRVKPGASGQATFKITWVLPR